MNLKLNSILVVLYTLIYYHSYSQNTANQIKNNEISHRGFFFSVGFGQGYTNIHNNSIGNNFSIKGSPSLLNIQIGLGVEDDMVLGFNFQEFVISMSDFTFHNTHYTLKDYYLYMMKKGIFLKKYFLPRNIFAEIELSVGRFIIANLTNSKSAGTNNGFGYGCKVGKEWMFGKRKNISFGINCSYSSLSAFDLPPYDNEKWKGNAIALGLLLGYH